MGITRRSFIKHSAAASLATLAALGKAQAATASQAPGVLRGQPDRIRVGLIGCGMRGTGAVINCLAASANVELVAMGDLFEDKLAASLKQLRTQLASKALKVNGDTCFTGFDAYKQVLACDLDLVLLAAPPHFRPIHFAAAVEAGRHVFMEKPVAVDPVGVRNVIASAEAADRKGLCVVAGTQRRHQEHYLEIMKRIHGGDIGELVGGQCYWNQDAMIHLAVDAQPEWSEMELQLRRWYFHTWLSGDHIVEQHVHNIDVINWAFGQLPVSCLGTGGRSVRTGEHCGNIYDHFTVEFVYPNGARVMSMCQQIDGAATRVAERVVGTRGVATTTPSLALISGEKPWQYDGVSPDPYVREHADLLAAIRTGEKINEGCQVAESTLCAIMGRMSAYTGRELSWKWAANTSKLDLSPPEYAFGDLPADSVALPGVTKLV